MNAFIVVVVVFSFLYLQELFLEEAFAYFFSNLFPFKANIQLSAPVTSFLSGYGNLIYSVHGRMEVLEYNDYPRNSLSQMADKSLYISSSLD